MLSVWMFLIVSRIDHNRRPLKICVRSEPVFLYGVANSLALPDASLNFINRLLSSYCSRWFVLVILFLVSHSRHLSSVLYLKIVLFSFRNNCEDVLQSNWYRVVFPLLCKRMSGRNVRGLFPRFAWNSHSECEQWLDERRRSIKL